MLSRLRFLRGESADTRTLGSQGCLAVCNADLVIMEALVTE